jgi:cellulose synthase/poly-beta-1,6-N-acetylglucosamine synthase-like glycosyltransferase
MVVTILTIWVVIVVVVMVLYTVRHFIFTFSRLFDRQRVSFGDAYEDDLPHITVLVPMHNEETVAEQCIDAILASDYPKNKMDVVAINDHSDDGTEAILDRYAAQDSRIKPMHLKAETGRGKAGALNAALETVDSDVVLVFDADYTPGKGLLRRLVMAFIDPEVGAVMGRVVPRNTPESTLTRLLSMERSGGYQVDQQARFNLNLLPQYGGTVGGFRLDLLKEIGGFDPQALSEDTELTASIYERGWKIVYDNRAECYEEVPETWSNRFNQLRRWSRGHNRVMWGHFRRVLTAKNLTPIQRADAAFLLFCYVIPPLLISGWIAEFVLLCLGQLPALGGVALALAVIVYNSFGNFAPVYEVATAEILDGHSTRLYLLPFLFYSFPFNAWTITTGFVDTVGDGVKSRVAEWEKTARSGASAP